MNVDQNLMTALDAIQVAGTYKPSLSCISRSSRSIFKDLKESVMPITAVESHSSLFREQARSLKFVQDLLASHVFYVVGKAKMIFLAFTATKVRCGINGRQWSD